MTYMFYAIVLLLITAGALFYSLVLRNQEIKKLEDVIREKDKDISALKPKADKYDENEGFESLITSKQEIVQKLESVFEELKSRIDPFQTHMELADTGHFRPEFKFEDVDKYSEALTAIKEAQKVLIKNASAIDTSLPDFKKSDIYKGLSRVSLLAFNAECESIIRKVTYSNFESGKEKLIDCFHTINKNLSPLKVSITEEFLDLKVKELVLGFEFEDERRKIQEEQAEIMSQMREEEAARVEAEEARLDAIEEEEKYKAALAQAFKEIEGKTEKEKEGMMSQIRELEAKLQEAHAERERATSMAQITKAGHVYIISNIGSFGENIYKIGMTRRKDPQDRVKELSDASVPFTFDVHAMVHTENAPELENALHRFFDQRRMNKINMKKEFFKVTLEEIETACLSLGVKPKLTRAAEAREYRETIEIQEKSKVA
ncbi:MAG: DUF4041 domain-containing protein [Bdellovibrionota bacterium]